MLPVKTQEENPSLPLPSLAVAINPWVSWQLTTLVSASASHMELPLCVSVQIPPFLFFSTFSDI